MHTKIRVGIVGATTTVTGSGWGAHAHVPALRALEDYDLKAVCTAHEETAKVSAAAFGAELAFHDFDRMLAEPDIDLIVIAVRAPWHYDLTLKTLRAGKATFCEWPLGANLNEAVKMAALARECALPSMVGLQGRSDAAVLTARELIGEGYIGDALVVNLKVISGGEYQRGATTRLWMAQRKNGAYPLAIAGSHAMDVVRYLLGEYAEVSAHVTTQTKQWLDTDTGRLVDVDSPDCAGIIARLQSGAEVTAQIATVPSAAPGFSLEIYGTKGRLGLSSGTVNIGPNRLVGAQGKDKLEELVIPKRFTIAPEATASSPRSVNVAQAYLRTAERFRAGHGLEPGFDVAVQLHRMLDAIERSANERAPVAL